MPDLTDIPGIPELWARTLGDPGITIAVIEGPVELERACFQGANLTKLEPYWQENIEIDKKYIDKYQEALKEHDKQVEKYEEGAGTREQLVAEREAELDKDIPSPIRQRLELTFHGNHICSVIFGQHGSPVAGLAPKCRGINIPIGFDADSAYSTLNLTRAINLAFEAGANIIHVSIGLPTQTGETDELLARAVRQCQENNILVVSPAGNDKGECWVIPSILPGVLAVGAMKDNGQPFKFSNWGGRYQEQGILAPGENILGATVGTDEPIRKKGTSCSTPIVTGIAGLLMSLQVQRGAPPDAEAVRAAILNSAIPCDPKEVEEPERCLRGKLNIAGAFQLLTGESLTSVAPSSAETIRLTSGAVELLPQPLSYPGAIPEQIAPSFTSGEGGQGGLGEVTASATPSETSLSSPAISALSNSSATPLTASQPADAVTPSQRSNLVYALGTLGYDFGSEARRDSFKQLMPGVNIDGTMVPANPYDARQMVDYLDGNLSEAKSLIWTLNQELTPIYALEPVGAFAADVYEVLLQMLAGQVEAEDSDDYIERVSVPGRLSDKTVKLFSGQEVPVIKLQNVRGMYGWRVNSLVSAAVDTVRSQAAGADEQAIQRSLSSFLQRIYYDLRNLGLTSRDRALNFAATNAFQAASTFAEAVARGMELDSIEVEKSPFCRYDSDCWDVKLKFFDPENSRRAKKVFRFTIDTIDTVPVTLGQVRSWSTPY
ncbi:MAG: PatA/PatG family cyanobactin maturation protease [Oscillatoria princeps RMCB-10]|nr:PatA/PatG family cyanobactin maturation protease [Oscillatoria princeps RMCB-10]